MKAIITKWTILRGLKRTEYPLPRNKDGYYRKKYMQAFLDALKEGGKVRVVE